MTTEPNAIAPGPAVISASDLKRTSATVSVMTKMSSIDQRPIRSTMRYSEVRSCGRQLERRCVVMLSSASTVSFIIGTRMLATNTMIASGQSPDVQK